MGLGQEMLKNHFLESFWSDFWVWAWKCLKIVSVSSLERATSESGPGDSKKTIPGSLLARLLGLGLEILENRFMEGFWPDFWD